MKNLFHQMMTNYNRNKPGSRKAILERLEKRWPKWTSAQAILGKLTEVGPWSEDLQDLVREGLVESQDSVNQMHMRSLIRLERSHGQRQIKQT